MNISQKVNGKVHLIDLASSDKALNTKKPNDPNESSKISVNLSILALGIIDRNNSRYLKLSNIYNINYY